MAEPSVYGGGMAKKVVQRVKELAKERGAGVARKWGEPMDGERLPREEIARLWNLKSPQADLPETQAMAAQLIAEGKHSQAVALIYPWRLPRPAPERPKRTIPGLINRGSAKQRVERARQISELAGSVRIQEAESEPGQQPESEPKSAPTPPPTPAAEEVTY